MIKRNLTLYWKDKMGVVFSLLGVLVIILLYAVFLSDSLEGELSVLEKPRLGVDLWLTAGILQVASVTTSMGSLNILIQDRLGGKRNDFYMLPMGKRRISLSYFLSAYIVGLMMTLVTFVFCAVYLYVCHGFLLDMAFACQVLLLTGLTSFTSTAISYTIVSFLSSNGAFSAVSAIIGTLIGFLTGIYFPIGDVADPVQKLMTLFPLSHGASLYRKIFMADIIRTDFKAVPAKSLQLFTRTLGIDLFWEDRGLSALFSVGYLLVFGVMLTVLTGFMMKKRDDTDLP